MKSVKCVVMRFDRRQRPRTKPVQVAAAVLESTCSRLAVTTKLRLPELQAAGFDAVAEGNGPEAVVLAARVPTANARDEVPCALLQPSLIIQARAAHCPSTMLTTALRGVEGP